MAGVKITDLGTLATAASDDLLYIVDVSDTSQSPQGTSKQIEVGKMFSSGSYSPTISGETNGIIVSVNSATYIKVGNIATVSAQLDITMDTGEDDGAFEIELPVASNFTSPKQCFGLMQFSVGPGTLAEIELLSINAEITNNTCNVYLKTLTPTASLTYCTLQFQYEILS
jgi:secreted trypsin-like serine protease